MNCEIRINKDRMPEELGPLSELAIETKSSVFQFAVSCLLASYFVYDLDKEEYLDMEEGANWIMEHITQIGPEAFNKELTDKIIAFLKEYGIHVHIINFRNTNPRNN